MQLRAPQQQFLHDMFTIESNGKNTTGADTSARHCITIINVSLNGKTLFDPKTRHQSANCVSHLEIRVGRFWNLDSVSVFSQAKTRVSGSV